MLLAQKDDDLFNAVVSMDVIHNSLFDVHIVFSERRTALLERLQPEKVQGDVITGVFTPTQMLVLRPRMNELNSLIEDLRRGAARNLNESRDVLVRLNDLLHNRVGVTFRVQPYLGLTPAVPPTSS